MLGTKALLEAQKPAPAPEIVVNLLEEGPTIPWTLASIAQGLDMDETHAGYLLADGRYANPLVANWMASHGFDLKPDGTSGYFVVSQNNGATYRLRIARESLTLTPSISSGAGRYGTKAQMKKERSKVHGWAVVFTADLPTAPIYFVADSMADLLQEKHLLNDKWKGDSIKLREYFIQAVAEGGFGACE